jgi:competence protein ComEC
MDKCKQGLSMSYMVMLSVGIFSVAWWPGLPSFEVSLVMLVCSIPLWAIGRLKLPLCLFMGMLWGIFSAHLLLADVLPAEFDGEDVLLSGTIVGLVDSNAKRSRFAFSVDSAQLLSDSSQQIAIKKSLISWYGKKDLRPGQRWQLVTRLRRPRGFVNPKAFDYQSWLYQQGYGATGYVRGSHKSTKLFHEKLFRKDFPSTEFFLSVPRLITSKVPSTVASRLRTTLRQRIVRADLSPRGEAVILALTIGDKQRLSTWWTDLARLGIVHLLVISGLHIGLIALIGTVLGLGLSRTIILFRRLFYRLGIASPAESSQHWIAPLSGLLAAFLYSLLAGFSLPTQRALIAVLVIVIARLSYRKIRPLVCMAWALLLIAISQPLAVLSAGFWLSFTAVGLLVWWFAPWRSTARQFSLRRTGTAQLALLMGMSVPLLFFLGKVSWLAPLVNMVAIPWVSFITVPLSLLGSVLLLISDSAAKSVWAWADWSVSTLWWLLDIIPSQLGFMVSPLGISPIILCAALLAGLVLLLPRGIALRWLGLVPLILLLVFSRRDIPLRMTVLDVGQGLAVIVQTEKHTLVYDTGVEYSKQFSAGSGIIAPYLWQQGRDRINATIISHEDGDHSGGFPSLQAVLPSQRLLVGPAVTYSRDVTKASEFGICSAGQSWVWDKVKFQVLWPNQRDLEGNNSSCVLQITFRKTNGREITILLPGDIERSAEFELLKLVGHSHQPLDVLIAPHHGSKTSSTEAFVQRLAPLNVVFSAGYRHQFGHPHQSVENRYKAIGSRLWNTGEQGAITFSWSHSGELEVSAARSEQIRWWR